MSCSRVSRVSMERSALPFHGAVFTSSRTNASVPAASWNSADAVLTPASLPRFWCVAEKANTAARSKRRQARSYDHSSTWPDSFGSKESDHLNPSSSSVRLRPRDTTVALCTRLRYVTRVVLSSSCEKQRSAWAGVRGCIHTAARAVARAPTPAWCVDARCWSRRFSRGLP